MQSALAEIVRRRTPHFIPRGEVIPYTDSTVPYRAVLHAVAIDGWYESNPEVIEHTVATALRMAADHGARRVALTALATGFGRLSLGEFAAGIRGLMGREFPPVNEVCICLLEDYRIGELAGHLPEAAVIP